ncbi:hypothetical protein COTS27_00342 [Spirochaetota bacterium]|nr:hypothetical protein COTS27_00342 [Spirochaetota bacterium]
MNIIESLNTVFRFVAMAAPICLAVIAYFTYNYAKSQLALLGKNNETIKNKNNADYFKEIFNLEEKMNDSYIKLSHIKLQMQTLRDNKKDIPNELYNQFRININTFYNRLENLCLYILNLKETNENKDLIEKIKIKLTPYFKTVWKTEKEIFEYLHTRIPFIKELFIKWNIWEY